MNLRVLSPLQNFFRFFLKFMYACIFGGSIHRWRQCRWHFPASSEPVELSKDVICQLLHNSFIHSLSSLAEKIFYFFLFCLLVRLRTFDFVSSRLSFIWIALKFQIIFIPLRREMSKNPPENVFAFVLSSLGFISQIEMENTRKSHQRLIRQRRVSCLVHVCSKDDETEPKWSRNMPQALT